MQNILVVVDMQNDFIDGTLGTKEAVAIVPAVEEKIKNFKGRVIFTRDTHEENYMDTQEGKNLPVPHCIKDTKGWEIRAELDSLRTTETIDKAFVLNILKQNKIQLTDYRINLILSKKYKNTEELKQEILFQFNEMKKVMTK